ncbi:MAG: asparagine synthase-related protein [Bacillota bacterium]
MRKYIGELLFDDTLSTKNMIPNSNNKSIDNNFRIDYVINTNDFNMYHYADLETTLILDGELYSNDYNIKTNDKNFLKKIVLNINENKNNIIGELNGSFNLLLYSHNSKEVKVINDRFATRPFYYFLDQNKFIFSNRMSEIAIYNNSKISLNYKAIIEFFKLQMVFGTKTFIENIYSLEKATLNKISNGKMTNFRYWSFKQDIDEDFSEKRYISNLSNLMKQIMSFKTEDEKKYGIFLSGGLDSRAIMAADIENKISQVYTLGDSFNIECEISKSIAEHKGAKFNYIERDSNHYYNIIKDSVEIGDGMHNYLNGHFIGYLDRINQDVDIIFNGSLIEQFWQGSKFIKKNLYFRQYKISLPFIDNNKENSIDKVLENFPRKVPDIDEIFNKELDLDVNLLIKETFKEMLEKNFNTIDVDPQEAIDYLACDSYGRYSSHLNQLCINNEINYRTIYDNRLIDLLLKVPIKYRSTGDLLRKAINQLDPEIGRIPLSSSRLSLKRNYNIQWMATNYHRAYNKLFKSKNYKSENYSWPNYSRLIIENEKIQQNILAIIEDEAILSDKIFDREILLEKFNQHIHGIKDHERILTQILTFGEWHKMIKTRLG